MVTRRQRILRRLAALGLGLALVPPVAEIALRIHNPIPLRLRGRDIVLPVNTTVVGRNLDPARLDEEIVRRRNSFGFRGPEPPEDFGDALTLVAVGGSTTECGLLSEGKTWPDLLGDRLAERFRGTWLNNAGLDGHSTFGHIHLLDQLLLDLAPDYLLFLVGVNDVDRDDANKFDLRASPAGQGLWQKIVRHSELLSTILVVQRSLRAEDLGVGHIPELDLLRRPLGSDDPAAVARMERRQHEVCLPRYRERLDRLIEMARARSIEPILVTQPALYGEVTDPSTGIDIGPRMVDKWTAALRWRMLEWFNEVTREVGRERGVLVIDLARDLPKDTRFFYDWVHFGNRGAETVAEILAGALIPFLAERHPDRVIGAAPEIQSARD